MTSNNDLIERLRKRAEIRRQISTRKSVQEGKPDRIADLLEEAANRIEELEKQTSQKPAVIAGASHNHNYVGHFPMGKLTYLTPANFRSFTRTEERRRAEPELDDK